MLVYDSDELTQGDWYFTDNDEAIVIRWGRDPIDTIQLALVGRSIPIWRFEGTKESPTLSPAIHAGGNKYRMTDGVLTQK